jgi:hypothetical protein
VVGGSAGSTSSGGGGGGTVALPPSAAHPLCSCAEKNFHKKTLDIMASCATTGSGCTRGYDAVAATPWWDCPRGSGSCFPGLPANQSRLHQQGWYENAASIKAKVALASSYSPLVAGVGVWTAHGADGSTAAGNEQVDGLIWDAFRDYVQGTDTACRAALRETCGGGKSAAVSCEVCVGQHQHQLRTANCTTAAIDAWCRRTNTTRK